MTPVNHHARFVFFLIVSIVGLITAWVFNGIASVTGQNYLDAWFGSAVDWVLSLDILIVAIAGSAFMIFEARKLGMKRCGSISCSPESQPSLSLSPCFLP